MGVVYTLAVGNFQTLSDEKNKLSLQNLKEYLGSLEYKKSAKILCLNDCSSCYIFTDGSKSDTLEDFLDSEIKTYHYEFYYGYTEAQKEVYFNEDSLEEDVCFSYEIDKNGAGEQLLVEYKDKYYDFSTYFKDRTVYDSIESATKAKEKIQREVMR
jgi:hypothetical protein